MKHEAADSKFQTTLWSVVLRAGASDEQPRHAALCELCRMYWKPLFVYCLGKGHRIEDAEDLTQAFFTQLLTKETLRVADPARGKFRAFLLTSFKHFILDEGDRARAARRGGGAVHLSFELNFKEAGLFPAMIDSSPERAYDRQWAGDLVERATAALRTEHERAEKSRWFELVAGPEAGASYQEVAAALGTTEEAVKSFAKRTRRRFRELLEAEIANTVGSPAEATEEMAYLVELLRG